MRVNCTRMLELGLKSGMVVRPSSLVGSLFFRSSLHLPPAPCPSPDTLTVPLCPPPRLLQVEHSHDERDAYLRRQFGLKMEKLYGIPYVAPSPSPPPPSLPVSIRTEEDTGVENDDEEEEEERREETEEDESEHTLLLQERGEGGSEGEKEGEKEEKMRKETVWIYPRPRAPEKEGSLKEGGKKGVLSAEEEDILKGLFDFRLARFRREVQMRNRLGKGAGKEVRGGSELGRIGVWGGGKGRGRSEGKGEKGEEGEVRRREAAGVGKARGRGEGGGERRGPKRVSSAS